MFEITVKTKEIWVLSYKTKNVEYSQRDGNYDSWKKVEEKFADFHSVKDRFDVLVKDIKNSEFKLVQMIDVTEALNKMRQCGGGIKT